MVGPALTRTVHKWSNKSKTNLNNCFDLKTEISQTQKVYMWLVVSFVKLVKYSDKKYITTKPTYEYHKTQGENRNVYIHGKEISFFFTFKAIIFV